MVMPAAQYLLESDDRDHAFGTYRILPDIDSEDGERVLQNLSDTIGRHVGMLIYANACPGCGKSLASADTFCDGCGDSQDSVFDIL